MTGAEVGIGRVVVAGLGPAGPDLVTAGTMDAIVRIPERRLRTARHPAASVAGDGTPSFDAIYEAAETMDDVYRGIVDALVADATTAGEVLYLVPGSPVVAERTVELLLADDRIDVQVLPALSFLDLAWVRLGVDPIATGVRVVDGHRFAVEAADQRGPLLVAQCDTRDVLSDVKLAVGDADEDAVVTVVQRLGLPDERVVELAWSDLDREVEPDHLTSVWIPTLAAPIGAEVARFVELVATLRRECPWDREQTHASLRRHLLEESYEVLDALDAVDPGTGDGYEHLEEELGDLLFQIVFHTTLATEAGQFGLDDVARGIHDKLRYRHPHVFGDAEALEADGLAPGETPDQVVANWEQLKAAEKGRASVFDGIPSQLPALAYALKVQKKASTLGELAEDVPSPASWDPSVTMAERDPTAETIGALLMAVVSRARRAGVDPELALRDAARRYEDAVRAIEG